MGLLFMYKFIVTLGMLYFCVCFDLYAAQDAKSVYGPTLAEYKKVNCELQKSTGYFQAPKRQKLGIKQVKLSNKLLGLTAKLTGQERIDYNKEYVEATNCVQKKQLTMKQMSRMGCENSGISKEEYTDHVVANNDSKIMKALLKTKMASNMYDKNMEDFNRHAEEQRELNGGGVDRCKEYDPYEHIPE